MPIFLSFSNPDIQNSIPYLKLGDHFDDELFAKDDSEYSIVHTNPSFHFWPLFYFCGLANSSLEPG